MRPHGFRFLDLPSGEEAQMGMAINMVPLAPGVIVLPAGNPVTKATLEANGVECVEVEISELMKGGGAVHCMTGVIHRAPAPLHVLHFELERGDDPGVPGRLEADPCPGLAGV